MVTSIPTGVVSFLFSDIEGSTGLWQADAEAMASSLRTHDEIFKHAASEFGGHVFSTAGDAFAVAFDSPASAVEAAMSIQRALMAADWPGPRLHVRLGINAGAADERDGDYFGPAVNLAARVMSAGQGGRVLITRTVADLLATSVTDQLDIVDHGSHRLSGFADPQPILEVRHADLDAPDGPLRSSELVPHNLPAGLSSFVGRSDELGHVGGLVRDHRLVTLSGVGGTGKTRLATEVGRSVLDHFPDGVWLVELASIATGDLVMTTVGGAFGLRPGEGATISEVVERYLWPKRLLLVVDNCEHVLAGAAAVIDQLLSAAPDLAVLATSRESLGVPGETVVRVPSLPVVPSRGGMSDAVRLFLDRAVAAGAPVAEPSMGAVDEICRKLDGIPLGVELAAARVRSISPEDLLGRLGSSFRILAAPSKTGDPRQRTLDATIGWSHDLLSEVERVVFRRASVFAGGFDLEALEAVAPGGVVEDWEVVDVLDSLVDKSLVTRADVGGRTRFRMLEPVRQFARRMLDDSGETDATLAAHADWVLGLARRAEPHFRGPGQVTWRDRLNVEIGNIRTAFETLLADGRIADHLVLAFDLQSYWVYAGMHVEAIELALAGLERAGEAIDAATRVRTWGMVALLGAEITSPDAIDHAERGLAIAREAGDDTLVARMELRLGAAIRHATTRPEYLDHLHEARRMLDETDGGSWWDPEWERALHALLFVAYLPASDPRIAEHTEVAVTGFERLGDRIMLAATLSDSAGLWGKVDPDVVLGNLRRSVEMLDGMDVPYWESHARLTYGVFLRLSGDREAAAVQLDLAAVPLDRCGDTNCWAGATRGAAACEAEMGFGDAALARLPEVVRRFDSLPMREVHLPRLLDTIVLALEAAGRLDDAAIALGAARDTPFDVETILPRDETLDQVEARLATALGDRLSDLMARGRGLDDSERLALAGGLIGV